MYFLKQFNNTVHVKIYIHNITTLFVLKILYCCNYISWYLSKVWREHPYFVTNAISKTQLNMYYKTKTNY